MNKKGELVLRNIIFMIIIFAGIIALSGILVNEMGNTYDNAEMVFSYNQDEIGSNQLVNEGSRWESVAENFKDGGIVKLVLGGLQAAGIVLIEVLTAPATFSNMLVSLLDTIGVSDTFQNIAGFILTSLLYILIVFSIIKVFLRGGDI